MQSYPSIRSTLFRYKKFVLRLNIDEFLKDLTSIKCCCNKNDNSIVKNHYDHTITGNLNIVNNEKLGPLIVSRSVKKLKEPKQISFEITCQERQTGIDQFIDRTSNKKDIHKNHFSEWKGHVIPSLLEKIHYLNMEFCSVDVFKCLAKMTSEIRKKK